MRSRVTRMQMGQKGPVRTPERFLQSYQSFRPSVGAKTQHRAPYRAFESHHQAVSGPDCSGHISATGRESGVSITRAASGHAREDNARGLAVWAY